MATLSSLEYVLDRIRRTLFAHPAFTTGGVNVDAPDYDRRVEELEKLNSQLNVVVRELKNKRNLAEMKGRNLRRLPMGERYLQLASVRGEKREIEAVMNSAEELRRTLVNLIMKNSTLSAAELDQGLAETVKNLFSHEHSPTPIHHLTAEIHQATPLPSHEIPEIGAENVAVVVIVLIRIFLYFKQKKSGKAVS